MVSTTLPWGLASVAVGGAVAQTGRAVNAMPASPAKLAA